MRFSFKLPYQYSEGSKLGKLQEYQFLLPIFILLAFFSQLVCAPFNNDGEQYFLYQLITPATIGHFGLYDILFELLIALGIMPRSSCKKQNRLNRMLLFSTFNFIKFTLLITGGSFGPIGYIGWLSAVGIYIQAGFITFLFLMIDKICEDIGVLYGGISIYNSVMICTEFWWFLLSPVTLQSSNGVMFEGVLVAFVHLSVYQNPIYAIRNLWSRNGSPDIFRFLLILLSVFVIIYLLSIRIVLKFSDFKNCSHKKSHRHSYRLISTGSMPVRLFAAIYLSKSAIPYLKGNIGSGYSRSTCIARRMIPSNLDNMCYSHSLSAQSPMLRAVRANQPQSLSLSILKIVGCGLLHAHWVSLTASAPSYEHEETTSSPSPSSGINLRNKQEVSRMLQALWALNGSLVGVLAVLGDILDFPIVSFIGFANFVIHCINYSRTQRRPRYHKVTRASLINLLSRRKSSVLNQLSTGEGVSSSVS